ncbi:MAG: MoaD/ThiS family protein [Spirochaetota bacterium]
MKIKLKLFATLQSGRFTEIELEVEAGADINFLLNKFNLKPKEVAIIFINGKHADYNTKLNEGDDIAFFPPIGGG